MGKIGFTMHSGGSPAQRKAWSDQQCDSVCDTFTDSAQSFPQYFCGGAHSHAYLAVIKSCHVAQVAFVDMQEPGWCSTDYHCTDPGNGNEVHCKCVTCQGSHVALMTSQSTRLVGFVGAAAMFGVIAFWMLK